jgi:glycogen operon protein
MTTRDWETGFAKSLGVFLNGDALPDPDPRGRHLSDDSFLLLLNGHHGDVTFVLPGGGWGTLWLPEFDTTPVPAAREAQPAGAKVVVPARVMQVLRRI